MGTSRGSPSLKQASGSNSTKSQGARQLDRHDAKDSGVRTTLRRGLTMNDQNGDGAIRMSRRGLLRMGAAGLVAGSLLARSQTGLGQASAQSGLITEAADVPRPRPSEYRFRVGAKTVNPDGQRAVPGIMVNGQYPGPEVRVREGTMLRVEVENTLADEPTSIHWHGLLVPAGMDGVPDVSGFPIAPKRVFVYEYPLLQSGTYWYHSHWRLQEQIGMAGPFVIEARDEPLRVDHDIVVMLGDWLYRSPYAALAALKKGPAKRMAVRGEDGRHEARSGGHRVRRLSAERPRHPGSLDLPGATRGAHPAPHYQRSCVDLLPVAPRWASARYHTRRRSCGETGHGRLSADGNGGDLRRGCDALRLRQLYAARSRGRRFWTGDRCAAHA